MKHLPIKERNTGVNLPVESHRATREEWEWPRGHGSEKWPWYIVVTGKSKRQSDAYHAIFTAKWKPPQQNPEMSYKERCCENMTSTCCIFSSKSCFPSAFSLRRRLEVPCPEAEGGTTQVRDAPARGEAGRTEHSGPQSSGRNGKTQRWKEDRVRENRVCCLDISETFFGPPRGKRESEYKN